MDLREPPQSSIEADELPPSEKSSERPVTEDLANRPSQRRQSFITHLGLAGWFDQDSEPLKHDKKEDKHHHGGGGATGVQDVGVEMFADADAMRKKAHEGIDKKDYDVTDFYWDRGICQSIARSGPFGVVTLAVISFNALWIGVETECNDTTLLTRLPACPFSPEDETPWMVGEQFFCFYFTFEVSVRFLSFKIKRDSLRDGWFVFDAVLVFMMVVESWLIPIILAGSGGLSDLALLKMIRLARLTRMVRLMRSVPELVTLLKGMVIAIKSVSYTLLLLVMFIYVFAIIFKSQIDKDTAKAELYQKFPSLFEAMWTLFFQGCLLDDITSLADLILAESPFLAGVFIIFVLLASLMILNMLIGVLCAVVTAVAAQEKERVLVGFVKNRLFNILTELDTDKSGKISKPEFDQLITHEGAKKALEDIGVDVQNLISLSDHLFESDDIAEHPGVPMDGEEEADENQEVNASVRTSSLLEQGGEGKEMSFAEFLENVIRLRANNSPSVADIVELRKLILKGQRQMLRRIARIEKTQVDIENGIKEIFILCDQNEIEQEAEHLTCDADCGGDGDCMPNPNEVDSQCLPNPSEAVEQTDVSFDTPCSTMRAGHTIVDSEGVVFSSVNAVDNVDSTSVLLARRRAPSTRREEL